LVESALDIAGPDHEMQIGFRRISDNSGFEHIERLAGGRRDGWQAHREHWRELLA
jgi:hypothetical protein